MSLNPARTARLAATMSGMLWLTACSEHPMPQFPAYLTSALDAVPADTWSALASRRIFFAHQSVGSNLASGLHLLLSERSGLPVRVVRTSDPDTVQGGALMHDNVGENGAPMTKTDAFADIVLAAEHAPVDIGMQKFCYADFERSTDPDTVFAQYVARIERLQQERPGLQIVHITAPLLQSGLNVKDLARRLMGRTTTSDRLTRVRRFNELLRQRYQGVEPIFDLAAIEAGGSPATARSPSVPEALLPAYATSDRGHLNTLGERVAAAELLLFLASLPAVSRS